MLNFNKLLPTWRQAILITLMSCTVLSCHQERVVEPTQARKSNNSTRKGSDGIDNEDKKKVKELVEILKKVYRDPEARNEVMTAIGSEYYKDETVLLKDLLQPEVSPIYKNQNFKSFKSSKNKVFKNGKFAQKFKEAAASKNGRIADDTYWMEGNLSIYFPYAENHTNSNYPVTVVDGGYEANEATVTHPECDGTPENARFCQATVRVNDNYAQNYPTHIVGIGAEVSSGYLGGGSEINKVLIGYVRCRNQYDRFISLSKLNGGGSEIKLTRIDGYLKYENEQVNSPGGVISVGNQGRDYITRKEIRNGTWIRVYAIWDSNWEPDNKEQVLGIYEEDNSGEQKFEGSITTKVKLGSDKVVSGEGERKLSYSITIKSQDAIIRQIMWNRDSFLRDGLNNQGHGFFYHDGANWPIYDGNSPVSWTMPFIKIQ